MERPDCIARDNIHNINIQCFTCRYFNAQKVYKTMLKKYILNHRDSLINSIENFI